MSKQNWKFIRNIFIAVASAGLVIVILPRIITAIYSWPRIYTADAVPTGRVAIVFGAGLTRWPANPDSAGPRQDRSATLFERQS